jgi:hypothetical protein
MTNDYLISLIKLRVSVSLLGEDNQFGWWKSAFFHSSSSTFLSPIFGKTSFMAKYYGVKEAASIIHDNVIGIGKGVYHLFRLPEMLERQFHELLEKKEIVNEVESVIKSKESALEFLQGLAANNVTKGLGPIRVGANTEIDQLSKWKQIAGCYLKAFQDSTKIFPYFSEDK